MIQQSQSWVYIQKTWKDLGDISTPVFTAALFTIVKRWKQAKCPSRDKWIKKCGIYMYIYKHNGIISLKKRKSHGTGINLKDIMQDSTYTKYLK